jgi:hypothetical protein
MKRYRHWWAEDPSWSALVHLGFIAATVVLWRTVIDQSLTHVFQEYPLKFVPFLLDARPSDLLDSWAMGDPRPRLLNVLGAWTNIELRGLLSEYFAVPPAMGINWLVYPAVLCCLYSLTRRLTANRNIALASAIIWGMSPPALDSLVCCYVPAKVLMNLWFVAACLAAAIYADRDLASPSRSGRFRWPLIALTIVTLLALFTDETSVFIILCIPIMFAPQFSIVKGRWRASAFAWAALLAPLVVYLVTALYLYPMANRAFGQVPLSFISASLRGPSIAMVGDPGASKIASEHIIGHLAANFEPLGLAYTMFTAHLIPNRLVPGYWTSGTPIPPSSWPLWEVGVLCIFFSVTIALSAILPSALRSLLGRIVVVTIAIIVVYAVLLVPLGPAVIEIFYYGALFSIPFSMGIAILLLGNSSGRFLRAVAIVLVAGLATTEAMGLEASARRTDEHFDAYFNEEGKTVPGTFQRNWGTIRDIRNAVRGGDFSEIAKIYPYPTRDFIYAFELEAWRRHSRGEMVDFTPIPTAGSLYSGILDAHMRWASMPPPAMSAPAAGLTETEFRKKGAALIDAKSLIRIISDKTWYGSSRQWSFAFAFDSKSHFTGRYWLNSIVRVWHETGSIAIHSPSEFEFVGTRLGRHGACKAYAYKGIYYVFESDGVCLFAFRQIPDPQMSL